MRIKSPLKVSITIVKIFFNLIGMLILFIPAAVVWLVRWVIHLSVWGVIILLAVLIGGFVAFLLANALYF